MGADQGTACFLGCTCTRSASNPSESPQVLLCQAALNPLITQPMWEHLSQPRCRTLHLAMLHFTMFAQAPFSSPVKPVNQPQPSPSAHSGRKCQIIWQSRFFFLRDLGVCQTDFQNLLTTLLQHVLLRKLKFSSCVYCMPGNEEQNYAGLAFITQNSTTD